MTNTGNIYFPFCIEMWHCLLIVNILICLIMTNFNAPAYKVLGALCFTVRLSVCLYLLSAKTQQSLKRMIWNFGCSFRIMSSLYPVCDFCGCHTSTSCLMVMEVSVSHGHISFVYNNNISFLSFVFFLFFFLMFNRIINMWYDIRIMISCAQE